MAKQVDKSKYDVSPDKISEWTFGEGAIYLPECRFVMRGGDHAYDEKGKKHARVGIWGSTLCPKDITGGDKEFQMWECEVVLIPKRKYRKGFPGRRADQILVDNFADPNSWDEQIFGPPHPEDKDNEP